MTDRLTVALQTIVIAICVTIVSCVALHHRYNSWTAILAVAALSGLGGYNLRGVVDALRRPLPVPDTTKN